MRAASWACPRSTRASSSTARSPMSSTRRYTLASTLVSCPCGLSRQHRLARRLYRSRCRCRRSLSRMGRWWLHLSFPGSRRRLPRRSVLPFSPLLSGMAVFIDRSARCSRFRRRLRLHRLPSLSRRRLHSMLRLWVRCLRLRCTPPGDWALVPLQSCGTLPIRRYRGCRRRRCRVRLQLLWRGWQLRGIRLMWRRTLL